MMKKSKGCAIALNPFEGRGKIVAVKNGPPLPCSFHGFAPKRLTLKRQTGKPALAKASHTTTMNMAWGKTLTLGRGNPV